MRPRRLVSLLVAGCMVVSMVPASAVTAFADAGAGTSQTAEATTTAVAQIGDTAYSTLQAAVTAAGENAATIILQNDVTTSDPDGVVIPKTANITLDLNGKTIEKPENGKYDVIYNEGTLTITDSKKTGQIINDHGICVGTASGSKTTIDYAQITAREGAIAVYGDTVGATVTVNDGVFKATDNAVVILNGSKRDGAVNEITINDGTFEGTITSSGYVACGIYAPWKDIITVNNGIFNITNGAGIVARAGNVTVNGGTFNTSGNVTGKVGDSRVVVPCAALVFDSEANYPGLSLDSKIEVKDGKFSSEVDAIAVVGGDNERVAVSGGEFSSDPSAYCVSGKTSENNNGTYTVKYKANTVVTPEEEKPGDSTNAENEVGKPVEIAVKVNGDEKALENIKTVSLTFNDPKAVEKVEVKANGKTVDLTKDYKDTNYQNIPLSTLVKALGYTGADTIALTELDESNSAPLAENPSAANILSSAKLDVTYNTPGDYELVVMFNDGDGKPVCSDTAVMQVAAAKSKSKLTFTDCTATVDGKEIASGDEVTEGKTVTLKLAADVDQMKFGGFVLDPQQDSLKKVDDTTATFTMPDVPVTVTVQLNAEDSDGGVDALTVVAGVAVGAGTAVLAYHIGTEVYAEQVLGKGVAVPKTRADVALKAWELAGKPAVAVGEPLSEAAQAEKWAVESGLMQNDAQGNFNGQKKMNKLAALRTLDAAKKLG